MAVPAVPTPAVIGYEADTSIVGSEFFVMEKIDGAIPTDSPSWGTEGFVVDASPAQRQRLWERTVGLLAEMHRLDGERFAFLRTGATTDGVGDCLDFWMRSLRWADPAQPVPLTEEAEAWLSANRPSATALSWGDSRLPNVIYRDFTPVGLLDWDLVSLAGPQADIAWWILMTPQESMHLDGIGTHDEFVDLWEELTETPRPICTGFWSSAPTGWPPSWPSSSRCSLPRDGCRLSSPTHSSTPVCMSRCSPGCST